jgi:hypothetical protein
VLLDLMRDVGLPNGLGDVGYDEHDIDDLAQGTLQQERLLATAPRTVTGTPAARATSMEASSSSPCRGRTTSWGTTRYNDASEEYIARVSDEASTSLTPARRSSSQTALLTAAPATRPAPRSRRRR